jgi:steroid delta-isomerase-like uncharacterized protein
MQGVDPATVVGRYIEECWNRDQLRLIEELVAEDFVDHFPFGDGLPDGRDGLIATIRLLRMAFNDLNLHIEDMVAEEDRVVVRFQLRGLHDGPLAGHPPTLRRVMINGMVMYRVEAHQIVDQWCMFDAVGLLRQIGAASQVLAAHS